MKDGSGKRSHHMVPLEGTWAALPVFPPVFCGGIHRKPEEYNSQQYGKWTGTAGILRKN